jgi:mannose-6-phosphate isomerase-like protein (cupin superfamily)
MMQAFEVAELLREQRNSGQAWHEFLRVPSLSMGVYQLAAGAVDGQSPHNEDEVYYVVSGKGQIMVADEIRPVEAGSVVFVAKHVIHRFIDISEDLSILVFFAPAET